MDSLYIYTHIHIYIYMLCLVAQPCPTLCNLMNYSLPGSSVHGNSPGKNTGVGCHALLQGIFPTQGSNPGLLHCRQIFYHLSHQGSLFMYKCVCVCVCIKLSFIPKKILKSDTDADCSSQTLNCIISSAY